jgi:hypothetical protein
LLEYFGRVPAAGGPVFNRALKPHYFNDQAQQRTLRKLGDLAREFAALTFKLLVPIRRLQTAKRLIKTISESKPHLAISRQLLPALGMGYPP